MLDEVARFFFTSDVTPVGSIDSKAVPSGSRVAQARLGALRF